MKFKSIFLISLLLLSTIGVVFASDFEFPLGDYDKEIPGDGEYYDMWDFGDRTICKDIDTNADDSCDLRSWTFSKTPSPAECQSAYGVDAYGAGAEDNNFGSDNKLQCKSTTILQAGSEDITVNVNVNLRICDATCDDGTKTFELTLVAPDAVEIIEEQHAPVPLSDTYSIGTSDISITGILTGYDLDEDNGLSDNKLFGITDSASNEYYGSVTLEEDTGAFTYTLDDVSNISGDVEESFDFWICDGTHRDIPDVLCSDRDGSDGKTLGTITINIEYVNVPPVWDETRDYTINLVEDQDDSSIDLDNYCSDAENLTFTESDSDAVVHTSINSENIIDFTSIDNSFGTQIMTVTCSDGVNSVQRDFTITVNPVNDAPTAQTSTTPVTLFAPSSQTSSVTPFNYRTTDDDGDELTVSPTLVSAPSTGSVDLNAMTYTYSQKLQKDTPEYDSFTIEICDSSNACVEESFSVTITGSNRPPFAYDVIFEANEDNFTEINFAAFRATDYDEIDTVAHARIISLGNPQIGRLYNAAGEPIQNNHLVTANNPIYFLSAANKSSGNYKFTFDVKTTDGARSTEIYDFTVSINPTEDAPVISDVGSVQMYEDSELMIMLSAQDADGDSLTISADADNLALFSELKLDKYNRLNLEPIEDQFGTATITLVATDGKNYPVETTFDVIVNPRNDRPTADDAEFETYRSTALAINSAGFTYNDIDSEDLSIKILSLPKSGTLTSATGSAVAKDSIYSMSDLNLGYSPVRGFIGEDSFEFLILDDDGATTERYTTTIDVLESQFGPNSQPSRFGGSPILLTGWSCKAGYIMNPSIIVETVFEAGTNACIPRPNIPPIANFTISVEQAQVGDLIFFLGTKSSDPDGIITDYTWKLGSEIVKTGKTVNHIYTNMSDCTAGVCTIELTVTDNKGDNATTTSTLILTEQEIESPDYSDLTIIQGNNYTNEELTYLGLKKGDITRIEDKDITVDTTGKVTKVQQVTQESTDESSQSEEPDLSEYGGSQPGLTLYTPYNGICEEGEKSSSTPLDCIKNDGYCAEALGEHSGNSDDCGEGGSWTGMFVLLAFLTLLGGGAFYAWKKGLLGSHNVSIGAKPTTTSTMPARPAEPAGPGQYIKTQRAKGFSNEQIRGALKNKGWDDDKIDEALNASRE